MKRRLLLIIALAGCSAPQPEAAKPAKQYTAPTFVKALDEASNYTIAILPVQNATAVEATPYFFRHRLKALLRARGYGVIAFDAVDAELIHQGVQSTDQLELIDFDTLARMTSADAILSGIVETAVTQNVAMYSGYAYTASLKLQDPRGEMLWYNLSERVAKRRIAVDPVNMVINTLLDADANKSVEAILAVADRLLETLPRGPVQTVRDDLFQQATQLPQ